MDTNPVNTPETARTPARRSRWPSRLPLVVFALLLAVHYLDVAHLVRPGRPVPLALLGLTQLDGQPLPASAIEGKVVVLNWWAPWCGPCRAEMPSLNALMQRSQGRVLVIGVLDDPATEAQAITYLRSHGLTYPVVQLTPALTQAFGAVRMLPTTLYLSPAGRVTGQVSGYTPELLMRLYAWHAGHAQAYLHRA